eukprot:gnl/MRDRNA2_/MRDRNA2_29984_c0_seq1.p1 gnl/MRDRNA2_/MRDRNA2_29984_c0~~gnl/MRDRNA2_/MRDRNA2_29984_c0_seq1.p1  ORF type:complete len:499 (+),score=100.30 gnl/MRDRNA2_/MRDRNA2_29984_c0_seq1:47-1543(+)
MAARGPIRQRVSTVVHAESNPLDVRVEKFFAHDEHKLGIHHKQILWRLKFGGKTHDWIVNVDEDPAQKLKKQPSQVAVTIGGKQTFKQNLKNDYEYKQPLRGTLKKIGETEAYEVQTGGSQGNWYRATLTAVRADGFYEAMVMMPLGANGECRPVHYPLVPAVQIRDPYSKRLVQEPRLDIVMTVGKENPLFPSMNIAGRDFTCFICRPSPPPGKTQTCIDLKVNRDRTEVTSDVGHSILKQFLDNKKTAIDNEANKLLVKWKFQFGPFCVHEIMLETKTAKTKECSVSVDGVVAVAGKPEDFGESEWTVDIALQGKNTVRWEVYEDDGNGIPKGATKKIEHQFPYTFTVNIRIEDYQDLRTAELYIDDEDFKELPSYKTYVGVESPMAVSVDTIEHVHNLRVPHAVQSTKGPGFVAEFLNTLQDFLPAAFCACGSSTVVNDSSQLTVPIQAQNFSSEGGPGPATPRGVTSCCSGNGMSIPGYDTVEEANQISISENR